MHGNMTAQCDFSPIANMSLLIRSAASKQRSCWKELDKLESFLLKIIEIPRCH
jgi:hypothetical protein